MKIVIDIPKKIYQAYKNDSYSPLYDEIVAGAVSNGTPYRKGTVKRVFCKGKEHTIEGYLDERKQMIFLSYVTVDGLRHLGFDIIQIDEEEE